ncbi:MAG: glycosyltransferase family 4 protein [Pseudomonadota bacterium]
MQGDRAPTVLLFRPDSRLPGGVANYFSVVLERFGQDVTIDSFLIGRRPGFLGTKLLYPLQFFIDCLRLALLLARRRFDIIHLNPSLNLPAFMRDLCFMVVISAFSRAQLLIFFRGWEEDFYRSLDSNRVSRFLLRWFCRQGDRILVLGSSIRDDLINLGIDAERIEITHTTFDGSLLRTVPAEAKKAGPFTFLFMSRFIKQKGIAELLEASRILKDRKVEFRLVLAGSGPFEATAHKIIDSLDLRDTVETPGYLKGGAKGETLVAADAFVFPTYHGEGCPNCLLEAMGASMPVISTRVGGIPDIVKPPSGGILLDSTEPDAIADAMETLVDDREYCARVGEDNYKVAWSCYEAGAVAKYLETLYLAMARRD